MGSECLALCLSVHILQLSSWLQVPAPALASNYLITHRLRSSQSGSVDWVAASIWETLVVCPLLVLVLAQPHGCMLGKWTHG